MVDRKGIWSSHLHRFSFEPGAAPEKKARCTETVCVDGGSKKHGTVVKTVDSGFVSTVIM